jgi:hypothetical protein
MALDTNRTVQARVPLELWQTVLVQSVTPGATYEDELLDQFIELRVRERTLSVLDMAPMIAEGAVAGACAQALLWLDPHWGLCAGASGFEHAELVTTNTSLGDAAGVPAELAAREWCVVRLLACDVRVLVAPDRLKPLGALAPGAALSWRAAATVLAGWRR